MCSGTLDTRTSLVFIFSTRPGVEVRMCMVKVGWSSRHLADTPSFYTLHLTHFASFKCIRITWVTAFGKRLQLFSLSILNDYSVIKIKCHVYSVEV